MEKSIAVIGCGNWGQNIVRTLHQANHLGAICESKAETAATIARTYNTMSLSLKEVLASDTIKGVMIATPAHSHYALALQALEAGKHVFVEKPLTLEYGHAKHLVERAQACNRILMVGHLLQYHAGFIALKEMVQAGEIGDVMHIAAARQNQGFFRPDEDCLWDLAPHDLSMLLSLTEVMPVTTHCYAAAVRYPPQVDMAQIMMTFPNKMRAVVDVSWVAPRKKQELIVTGSKGVLVLDDTEIEEQKLKLYRPDAQYRLQGCAIPFTGPLPLTAECAHFVECIIEQKNPLTNGAESLKIIEILAQASIPGMVDDNPMVYLQNIS